MGTEHEIILVSITGEDRPGVTTAMTEVLGKYGAEILDIGQADIHHSLSLGILFRIHNKIHSGDAMKELLFKSFRDGCQHPFSPGFQMSITAIGLAFRVWDDTLLLCSQKA